MTAALLALNERTFASLKLHRNYRLFFTGQVISVSGTWMQNVALAWLVVELTHSPLAVGVLAFCRFIPFTIFGLVAGVVADRIDNRKLVISTQATSMILSAAFAVLVLGGLETLWVVYLLAILSSTALVFDAPGRHALTFQMVGREELPNAVALNASLFNASRVVGPAVAGVLIAAFGVGICFAINTVTFLAVLIGPPDDAEGGAGPRRAERRAADDDEGHPRGPRLGPALTRDAACPRDRHCRQHRRLQLPCDPAPARVRHAGHGARRSSGSSPPASAAARSSERSSRPRSGGRAGRCSFSAPPASASACSRSPAHSVVPCAILLFGTGVCFTLWTSNANSILQLRAPDHLRGRVVSLYLWAFAGLAPLGGLLAGWLCEIGGTQLSFAVAGATGLLMAALAARERQPATGGGSGVTTTPGSGFAPSSSGDSWT